MFSFPLFLGLVEALPKVIAAAPEFKKLFDQVLLIFNEPEQEQLKTAYAKAREESDSAQEDFVKASKGD